MVNFLQAFWQATRPRTYPLAVAGIIVANALAYSRIGSLGALLAQAGLKKST